MTEINWHGWTRAAKAFSGKTLHIGPLPTRKSICLYTMDYTDGAVMHVHAYFRSEEEAIKAMTTLDGLLLPNDRFASVESQAHE